MKRIEWLCPIPDCSIGDLQESNLASIRLRTAVGAQTAKASGYKIAFSDGQRRTSADLVIVGKIDYISDIQRAKRWLEHLRSARQNGARIVIDYTDHHIAVDSPAASFYKEALNLAHTIVCSSQTLADHLAEYASCERIIIEDPIEVNIKAPKDRQSDRLTALWFGHASNLRYLIDYLRYEFRPARPTRLILMTNAYPFPQEFTDQLNCPELDLVEINVVPWSLENMVAAAAISDVCLLPAGLDDPRKNGASSNRLLTALALGLPVAADLLPSYQPFRSCFAHLRSEETQSLLDSPARYFARVEQAQTLIRTKFTKTAIAADWLALIKAEFNSADQIKTVATSNRNSTAIFPKLQVLVISYKQEHLCQRIITNIESYVSENVEVLIQDDCSPDRTYELLAKHFDGHPFVSVFRNETNLGASRNSASLISKATSEYVLNLGGDDFIVAEELQKAIALLAANPVDVGIFNCAHTDLAIIDHLILGKPKTTDNLNIFLRNNQFTEATNFSDTNFYEQIATMPGALWGQGVVFRTSLLKQIQLLESGNVEEWGLFHNLAVHAQSHPLRTRVFKPIVSLLAVLRNSRGSDVEAQLTRQLCAVINDWHASYRKTALINVLEKKLKQFRNSSLGADEVVLALKNSFSEV
jgi:glycosyltransferase involved in cell wall biosynthesis